MSTHSRHCLRMPAPDLAAAEAWAGDCPERALWLGTEAFEVGEGFTEHIVREVIRAPQGATKPPNGARLFALQWAADPSTTAPHALRSLFNAGAAGAIVLPAPGSILPACGFLCHPHGAGIDGLDALHLAGAGLRRIDLSQWAERGVQRPAAVRPRPAWRRLAGTRIVVVGAMHGAAVALALADHGARHLALLDDGGRVDLAALSCMEGLVPEAIGQFKVDALADAVAARSGHAVVAHACDAKGLHDALSRLLPDIVICCDADRVRRAVLAAWCGQRQRLWLDIATTSPALVRGASGHATLRVYLPALPEANATADAAQPHSRDLFDDLPLPVTSAATAIDPALQHHCAQATVQALHELLRGRIPQPLRIQVSAAAPADACVIEADDSGDFHGYPGAYLAAQPTAVH